MHPTVALVEDYGRSLAAAPTGEPTLAERLALERADRQSKELLPKAAELRDKFRVAGLWFGVWCGVVIGVKWISLGMVRRREEFQPDRTTCFACARCFSSCPQERIRLGWLPRPDAVVPHPSVGMAHPVPAAKSGGCGCGGGSGGGGA
jgi:ferredoxin